MYIVQVSNEEEIAGKVHRTKFRLGGKSIEADDAPKIQF